MPTKSYYSQKNLFWLIPLYLTDLVGCEVSTFKLANANGSQNVSLAVGELVSVNYLITVTKEGASYTQNLMVK